MMKSFLNSQFTMPENISGYQRTTLHPKRDFIMSAAFNHTIVAAADPAASAQFYVDILEAEHTQSWGPFANVMLSGGVMLQFASPPPGYDILPVHMAFLCSDDHFGRALDLLKQRELDYWADPQRTRPQETNTEHGGRGVYFLDPSGMYLELITRPYL